MSTGVYAFTALLVPATVIVVFAMKYVSAAVQARARAANDAGYRALAEKAVAVQSENQATLSAIRADLARLATSVATVEKVLQQID